MEATGVRILRRIATSIILVVSASAFANNHSPLFDTTVCAPDGVAVGGYDVVSYREDSGPVPGAPEFAHDHDGLTYRFANSENLNAFLRDPGKYLPMYRGWCSATLAMGRLACPDYTNFKIENGDLLLFEIVGFTNGRDVWDSDPVTHRRNADSHFRRLLGE